MCVKRNGEIARGWLVGYLGIKCTASNEASGFVHYHIIRILAFGCWSGQSDCRQVDRTQHARNLFLSFPSPERQPLTSPLRTNQHPFACLQTRLLPSIECELKIINNSKCMRKTLLQILTPDFITDSNLRVATN